MVLNVCLIFDWLCVHFSGLWQTDDMRYTSIWKARGRRTQKIIYGREKGKIAKFLISV